MNTHKYLFRMIFCCLFILVLGGSALAAGEAGQVLEVSGEATLAPGAAKVAAFTKFKPGDVFTLGQNAKLKLVYFANEREESWSGPGSFVAGAQKSEGREGLAAQVSQPQKSVGQEELKDAVSGDNSGRAGVFTTRGAKKKQSAQ